MRRFRHAFAAALLLTAPRLHAQDLIPRTPAQPVVRDVRVTGAKELADREAIDAMRVRIGEPLPEPVEALAQAVERHYRDAGYIFARVTAELHEPDDALTVAIDEGVIGGVEFRGVTERVAREFAADFALRAGDVFNRARARQALRALLRPTRGAIAPSGRPTFDLIDRDGRRILVVGLREPDGRFKIEPDLGDREDWFTPVDGFVPSLGMAAVAFDHERFNHTFIAGHLSFKLASNDVGYALGFERPLFGARKLYVGGELHDLTTTDQGWQLSSNEASIDAAVARRSFRDYYERRGVQITGAWRVDPRVELLVAWRGEREQPLHVQSDFSIFNGDDLFRPNAAAENGRLNAVVLGATIDGTGFDREPLAATYTRHQLDTLFGSRLPAEGDDGAPVWRIDWTSELSTPGALSSDFDFKRHIVNARLRERLSEFQDFGVRAIGGWSEGVLPPQRQFAIGGIGSVHGYAFHEAVGDTLALVNLEYAVGWRHGLRAVGFFDAGRVTERRLDGGLAPATASPWLKGVGFGFAVGDAIRLDFGYKVAAVPSSLQVLLRFGRTF